VVQVSSEGSFRGVAEWSGDVEASPLCQLFSNGRLAITVEPEDEGESYQSIVGLGDAGLTEALENYFRESEQIDTRIWLTADEEQAAGFLLQEMPNDVETPLPEDEDAWNRIVHLGSTIKESELREVPVKELLHRLFYEEDIRLFDSEPVNFRCDCTRERIEETLRSLGYDDVHDILEEQEDIEVQCSFCNQTYLFDLVDAERIFAAGVSPDIPDTMH
jgi:molecular chaperone Hsp33